MKYAAWSYLKMHRNIQPFKLTFSFSFPSSSFVSQSPPPTFNSGKCDCSKKEVKIKSNHFFYFSYFFFILRFLFWFRFSSFPEGPTLFLLLPRAHIACTRERAFSIYWLVLSVGFRSVPSVPQSRPSDSSALCSASLRWRPSRREIASPPLSFWK